MIDDLSIFLIFSSGCISWTIAFGQILENKKQLYHYLFAALMFILGVLQVLDGILVSGKLNVYTWLSFWYIPCIALLGPLFFLTFKSMNIDSFRFRRIDFLHFAFIIALVPFLAYLSTLDRTIKLSFIMQAPDLASEDPLFRVYSGVFVAVLLYITGYFLYFARECLLILKFNHSNKRKISPYLKTIIFVSYPIAIIFIGGVIGLCLFDNPQYSFFDVLQTVATLSFIPTLIVFIMEKKEINFFRLLYIEIENRRYETSKVKNLDVESVLGSIQSLMEDERIFCDEDLSVNGMARELGIEPYQLSQIINETFNKNFNRFINEYRIEEAKKILVTERDRTIISVAYAVGFNSTTVFYRWFNLHTGVSPKKFRSMNKNHETALLDRTIDN